MLLTNHPNDSYFHYGLELYLKYYGPRFPLSEDSAFFFKLSIHNLIAALADASPIFTDHQNIVLVSSRQCLPLAIFLTAMRKNTFLIKDFALYSNASNSLFNLTASHDVLTDGEFRALKKSLATTRPVFFNNARRKTFYSQRATALKKLGVDRISSLYVWNEC